MLEVRPGRRIVKKKGAAHGKDIVKNVRGKLVSKGTPYVCAGLCRTAGPSRAGA